MIIVSLLILLLVASTVALRLRLRGSWTIVVGLSVVFLYLIFRQTFAQNAELLFSPWGDAVARMAYGAGALLFAVGYARMCRQLHRERHAD
jgi:4-amino-4-deoxy-L-arabinose transferase-like glycosyltransferase